MLDRAPLCEGWPVGKRCLAAATHADHILPLRLGGAPYELENGQGLCAPCHAVKTSQGL